MATFGKICNGTVSKFNDLFIFVMAWCSFNATNLSRETLHTIYFPNLRRPYSCWFFASYLQKIVTEKKSNELKKIENNCTENLQWQFSDFSNLMTILSRKNAWKAKFLPKIGITKLENQWKTKIGIRISEKLVKSQILPKIVTENRFYTKFKFVKINTVCNNSLLQWRLLACLF